MADPIKTNFGPPVIDPQWLRAVLEQTGCSQEELARRIGYSRDGVAKWLGGSRKLKPVVWTGILVALGQPLDWQPPPKSDP